MTTWYEHSLSSGFQTFFKTRRTLQRRFIRDIFALVIKSLADDVTCDHLRQGYVFTCVRLYVRLCVDRITQKLLIEFL